MARMCCFPSCRLHPTPAVDGYRGGAWSCWKSSVDLLGESPRVVAWLRLIWNFTLLSAVALGCTSQVGRWKVPRPVSLGHRILMSPDPQANPPRVQGHTLQQPRQLGEGLNPSAALSGCSRRARAKYASIELEAGNPPACFPGQCAQHDKPRS